MPECDITHVQDDENTHILHMLEDTVSLDAAHLIILNINDVPNNVLYI